VNTSGASGQVEFEESVKKTNPDLGLGKSFDELFWK